MVYFGERTFYEQDMQQACGAQKKQYTWNVVPLDKLTVGWLAKKYPILDLFTSSRHWDPAHIPTPYFLKTRANITKHITISDPKT
jgi:hypothetical protein